MKAGREKILKIVRWKNCFAVVTVRAPGKFFARQGRHPIDRFLVAGASDVRSGHHDSSLKKNSRLK